MLRSCALEAEESFVLASTVVEEPVEGVSPQLLESSQPSSPQSAKAAGQIPRSITSTRRIEIVRFMNSTSGSLVSFRRACFSGGSVFWSEVRKNLVKLWAWDGTKDEFSGLCVDFGGYLCYDGADEWEGNKE